MAAETRLLWITLWWLEPVTRTERVIFGSARVSLIELSEIHRTESRTAMPQSWLSSS